MRKAFIGLATPALAFLILASVILMSLNLAFHTPQKPKQWIQKSNIYSHAVNALIDQVSKDTTSSNTGLSMSQPEVQTAFKKAVTPQFLQSTAESVIDGSYEWLQGKVAKPSYDIDLTPVKTAFADALEAEARNRLATLPVCSYYNLPTTADPFSVTCNPPSAITNQQIAQLRSDILSGNGFIVPTAITADTTSLGTDTSSKTSTTDPSTAPDKPAQPWYKNAQQLPFLYALASWGPWVTAVLALLVAVGLFFAAKTKRFGTRIISSSVLSAGLLLGLSAGVALFVSHQFGDKVAQSADTTSTNLQQPMIAILRSAVSYIARVQLWWGVGLAVVGLAGLLLLFLTRPKPGKTTASLDNPKNPSTK